ncbi:General secretion pathway protein F [hydrothermal vent metagenome]|uniref:General secretion pathway protein F n=1 Tax=hydrothermal vent metagenome TaxID=652676 RepID=A0A3B1AU72_9ZZZZ
MGAFEYQALDQQGRQKKGIIESDTPRVARQLLRDMGLTPLSVDAVTSQESRLPNTIGGGRSLGTRDLALLTRQLATLSQSGIPLEEALLAVSQQTSKSYIRRIILGVRTRVLEGQSLSNALGNFPNAFPGLYRATVDAGESSGKLDFVLEKLADYEETREQMHQKVQLAMIYPALLTTISILIVIGLLAYVVPEISVVFENMGQKLPTLTVWLISASNFLLEYGLYMLAGLSVMGLTGTAMLQVKSVRFTQQTVLLKLPLVARIIRGSNAAGFTRTLAILTGSGVELLEALRIASQVIPNLPMRQAVEKTAARVREGDSLSHSLGQTGLFPPITVHLIASGESSGQLPRMLESAANNQQREVQTMTEMLVGIFEPLMILFMGIIVLLIVIAILLPIFEMNQLVR